MRTTAEGDAGQDANSHALIRYWQFAKGRRPQAAVNCRAFAAPLPLGPPPLSPSTDQQQFAILHLPDIASAPVANALASPEVEILRQARLEGGENAVAAGFAYVDDRCSRYSFVHEQ